MDTIEIPRSEYDELRKRPEQAQLDDAIARAEKAEKDLEVAEAAQKKAEEEAAELKGKVQAAEEQARQQTLRDERMEALGAGFVAALGEKTKDRLRTQAASLDDGEWTARLEELEELTGKKRDLGAPEKTGGEDEFKPEEIAAFQGGGSSDSKAPTPTERRSVLAGL